MSYKHLLVKDAKAKAASMLNPEYNTMEYVRTHNYKLYDFFNEVKKVKPSVQPIVISNKVYLHFKGDPYTAAWIGYGNFKDAGSGDKTYVVCAPSVENNRYEAHRDKHYMRMSINLKKAVGFTSTFTRPYKALTIAEINLRDVGNAAGMSHGELSNKVDEMRATLFGRSYSGSVTPVMAEIKHLVASGYSFMDKKLEAEAHEFFELQRKQQASATLNKNLAATAVICMGTTLKGEQKFETVRCNDIGSYNREVLRETHQYYIGTDKIPDEIKDKVAVLSMMEHGEFVDEVGMRICDEIVYVMDTVEV
jgi:hypothetical protein